ncbi:MAG: MFS transporter, partial [Deltaproteobacteria bacterium]|nr:MFS transporter [Deltaproteobacteria bacterium]
MAPSAPSKSFLFPVPPGPLRILKNSNYMKYFSGQLVSMSGSWMQSFAQALLVYELSHKRAYWLGIITFAGQLPAFLISPFSGVVADRHDRRKILIWVQVIEMVQALLLAALCFMGVVQLWHVVVLAVVLGMVNAFDMTTRHAFAVDMVGKSDLSSAIALNS